MRKNITLLLNILAFGISVTGLVIAVQSSKKSERVSQLVSGAKPRQTEPEVRPISNQTTNPWESKKQNVGQDDILSRLTRLEEKFQELGISASLMPPPEINSSYKDKPLTVEELSKMAGRAKEYEKKYQERQEKDKKDVQKTQARYEEDAKKFGTTFAQMQKELTLLFYGKEGTSYVPLSEEVSISKYSEFIEKYSGTLLSAELSQQLGHLYFNKGEYALAEEAYRNAYQNGLKSDTTGSSKKGGWESKSMLEYQREDLLKQIAKVMIYNNKLEEAAKWLETEGGYPDGKQAVAEIIGYESEMGGRGD